MDFQQQICDVLVQAEDVVELAGDLTEAKFDFEKRNRIRLLKGAVNRLKDMIDRFDLADPELWIWQNDLVEMR